MRVRNIEESGGFEARMAGLIGLGTPVNSKDCVMRVQNDETKDHGMAVLIPGRQRRRELVLTEMSPQVRYIDEVARWYHQGIF